MKPSRSCPRCGAELPAGTPPESCPRCLLKLGLAFDEEGEPEMVVSGRPSAPPPAPEILAPDFPQLEILEIVGQGGMGVVYKARQKGLDRLVALKLLYVDVEDDAAFAERFSREARALASLAHPNVVTVYDSGHTNGRYWLLMEYVDGTNLRQMIRAGTVPAPEALAIVSQVCEALQFAHDEGVVHRDIKPENILVDRRGRVKIADFGLAKLLGRVADPYTLTGTHQAMGTPHYMAPEQVEHPTDVDHRADIYSLGVVFYELLTGELPLGRFGPPSERVRVDVRIDEVVLRTLEKDPQRRYQHASEVKTKVDEISSSAGTAAAGAAAGGAETHRERRARRHRERGPVASVLLVALLVLAVLGGLGVVAVGAFFLLIPGRLVKSDAPGEDVTAPVPVRVVDLGDGGTPRPVGVRAVPSVGTELPVVLFEQQPASALRALKVVTGTLDRIAGTDGYRLRRIDAVTHDGVGPGNAVEVALDLDVLAPTTDEGKSAMRLYSEVLGAVREHPWVTKAQVSSTTILEQPEDLVRVEDLRFTFAGEAMGAKHVTTEPAGISRLAESYVREVAQRPPIDLAPLTLSRVDVTSTDLSKPDLVVTNESLRIHTEVSGAKRGAVIRLLETVEMETGAAVVTEIHGRAPTTLIGGEPDWEFDLAIARRTARPVAVVGAEPARAVTLPPSALEGLELVLDVVRAVPGEGQSIVLRGASARSYGRGLGPEERIRIDLELDCMAADSIAATGLVGTLEERLRASPWLRELESSGTQVIGDGAGVRVRSLQVTLAGPQLAGRPRREPDALRPALGERWIREVASRDDVGLGTLDIERSRQEGPESVDTLLKFGPSSGGEPASLDSIFSLLEAIDRETADGAVVELDLHREPRGEPDRPWSFQASALTRVSARD